MKVFPHISNLIHQADHLFLLLNSLEENDPHEFSEVHKYRDIIRLFLELVQKAGFKSDAILNYSSIHGEIIYTILIGEGKLDLRLLFESMLENHSPKSMMAISKDAGVSPSIASNYRNKKNSVTVETYEKLVNQMLMD